MKDRGLKRKKEKKMKLTFVTLIGKRIEYIIISSKESERERERERKLPKEKEKVTEKGREKELPK